MNRLVLDFETYWSAEYTLSKLTTEAYVRDPRFKAHMVGFKMNDQPIGVVYGDGVAKLFKLIDWGNTAVVMQHGQFDGLILSYHYGVKPAFMCDTLSMFRALYPAESASLANIARVLGLEDKGSKGADTTATKGKRYLTVDELRHHGEYCKQDVELTAQAFNILAKSFTLPELKLIDLTIKMFTDPVLEFNKPLLEELYDDERAATLAVFQKAMPHLANPAEAAVMNNDEVAWKMLQKPLSSNPQFAQMLMGLGIDPPKKISPAKLKSFEGSFAEEDKPIGLVPAGSIWTYAFAKNDQDFKLLMGHEDDNVRTLVEARLGVKSTIKETRAKRFIGIAERGPIPVYLRYAGAHTLRWSGGDKTNYQNLSRGSKLREAIEAPEGYAICVQDLSGIEARVLAWLAEQEDAVEVFRQNKDPYCEMATSIFGRVITKEDKLERFLGKAVVLGCGYGLGWKKFEGMLRIGMLGNPSVVLDNEVATALGSRPEQFAIKQNAYLTEAQPPNLTREQFAMHCACAFDILNLFRSNRPQITEFWNTCNEALISIMRGEEVSFGRRGIVKTCPEGFKLPSGMLLRYTELEAKKVGRRVEFSKLENRRRGDRSKVYGGLVTENLVQRLARDIIAEQMLEVAKKYRVATMTHDEIVCVVEEDRAEECCDEMNRIMCIPPKWAFDLPLGAEGGYAKNYTK